MTPQNLYPPLSLAKPADYFGLPLSEADPELARYISLEHVRQRDEIELIASENMVSQAVLDAQGSILTNKYAEGYPARRYYGGCEEVDKIETLCIDRAKALFDCAYANVQPHSGSQANQAVFLALLQPGDTILGMDLASGGHLTHGAPPNMSGKWFNAVFYGVNENDHLINFDQVEERARKYKPRIIIAGGSAYSRIIDFARFRKIADSVGAYLLVDMAHFAGLVAAGIYPSPLPHAHVVTSTTHKTLRGPRGGIILSNDIKLGRKFDSAIFPGLQGGPLMHVIAGKAAAFGVCLTPEFREYGQRVVANCRAMADALVQAGYAVISGGTDTHLALIDLSPKGLKGDKAEIALSRANIIVNKNGIPFDTEKFTVTSGIRIGSPAGTSRGFGVEEFRKIGKYVSSVLDATAQNPDGDNEVEALIRNHVKSITGRFPIYV